METQLTIDKDRQRADFSDCQQGVLQRGSCVGDQTVALSVSPDSISLPVPQGFLPEGVDETCVDAETLYLLEHALPPHYRGMVAHLLSYATLSPRTSMQPSLFRIIGEAHNEAIVLISSVDALAKSPNSPCGPETYHKGILAMEALQGFRRKFHRGFTEIRIPLGKREIHIPSLLQALRQLHDEYNNVKVKQFAKKVAKRLKSEEFASYTSVSATQDMPGIREALSRLLQEHGVTEERIEQVSLDQACTVITQTLQATQNGRVLAETGASMKACIHKSWATQGDSVGHAGEFVTGAYPTLTDEGDQEGEFTGSESPTSSCKGLKHRSCHQKAGELDTIFGAESPALVKEGSINPHLGDSVSTVSLSVFPSLRVITDRDRTLSDTSHEIPVYSDPRPAQEIRRDVQDYKNRFDKNSGRQFIGSLYNAVRGTPPEIRRLAAIATIFYSAFRLPDGSIVKSPGGLFTTMCKRYRQPGADIPQEIRAWDTTGLDLDAIEVYFKRGIRHPSQPALPFDSGVSADLSGEYADRVMVVGQLQDGANEAYPVPARYELPVPPSRFLQNDAWMNRGEAEDLSARILREGRLYGIQARVVPGEQEGTCVVVTTWNGVEEEMCNVAEWVRYFAETRDL